MTTPFPIVGVDRRAPVALYRQIYLGYRDAIVAGRLRPGQRLASTRALAKELGLSRLPVLTAFEQLLAEGYCEARAGSGTYVASTLPARPTRGPRPAPERQRPEAVRRIAAIPAPRSPSIAWLRADGPFTISRVALDSFPDRIWAKLLARHARRGDHAITRYGDPRGYLPFREAVAGYLRTARGVVCEADQVLVVSGSQQGLALSARVLLEPGDDAWLEDPGYWGARDVVEARGAKPIPVPVDGEGLDVGGGIRQARDLGLEPRAAFVTPSHQFPLGAAMSASRRLELLEWARTRGVWIVEDDYNSEFRYQTQPVPALQGFDRAGRVVYVGTLSKVVFPSLRLGFVVPPNDLVPHFLAARRGIDLSPPTLLQAALADFIGEGHFGRHLRRTRDLYRERRRVLVERLEAAFGDAIAFHGDPAGMHLTVTFTGDPSDVAIAERAAEIGLRVLPLSALSFGATRRGLVLGFGGIRVAEIAAAVRTLREVVAQVRRSRAARPGGRPLAPLRGAP